MNDRGTVEKSDNNRNHHYSSSTGTSSWNERKQSISSAPYEAQRSQVETIYVTRFCDRFDRIAAESETEIWKNDILYLELEPFEKKYVIGLASRSLLIGAFVGIGSFVLTRLAYRSGTLFVRARYGILPADQQNPFNKNMGNQMHVRNSPFGVPRKSFMKMLSGTKLNNQTEEEEIGGN
jgi:hypothetical protein